MPSPPPRRGCAKRESLPTSPHVSCRRMNPILVIVLVAHSPAWAQAYKCTDTAGAVKYQQAPCTALPAENKVRLFYDPDPDSHVEGPDPAAAALPDAARVRFDALVSERKVAIGMTAGMVRRSWGLPKRVNSSLRAAGQTSEQWVYANEYVYLENGRVRSIQTSRDQPLR